VAVTSRLELERIATAILRYSSKVIRHPTSGDDHTVSTNAVLAHSTARITVQGFPYVSLAWIRSELPLLAFWG
jgi:hypothetical protein